METRNYAANAAGTPPAAPVTPSNGFPTAADPGNGVPATIPGPHWFYKIGESLRNIIIDAGLIPDDTDLNQLLAAIRSGSPAGILGSFAMTTAPAGWLECNGAAVSRASYSSLFAAVGTVWGAGDGTTTFNLPDFRGEFMRGFDNGRGVDAGRVFGVEQLDALQNIIGSVLGVEAAHSNGMTSTGAFGIGAGSGDYVPGTLTPLVDSNTFDFDASRVARTSTETRPTNNTALICIKY